MATVALQCVWLNDAADPADCWPLYDASDLRLATSQQVVYQQTAGGRTRAIVLQGTAQSWALSCGLIGSDAVAWLRSHVARLVCVRDPRGRKAWGIYDSVDEQVIPETDGYSTVSLTITEVTYSEAI